jgi:hypothetical protein
MSIPLLAIPGPWEQADNRFTHHRNHLPDVQRRGSGGGGGGGGGEMEEEDYLPPQDQACFLHTDEPLTQNS